MEPSVAILPSNPPFWITITMVKKSAIKVGFKEQCCYKVMFKAVIVIVISEYM